MPNYPPAGQGTIDGTVQTGETPTANTPTIQDDNDLGTFSYQRSGENCANSNADGDNYAEELSATSIDLTGAAWQLSLSRGNLAEGQTANVTLRTTNGHTYNRPVVATLYFGNEQVTVGAILEGQDGAHTVTVPAGQ